MPGPTLVTLKDVVVCPAGIVTLCGTVATVLSSLDNDTSSPPVGAGCVSVTSILAGGEFALKSSRNGESTSAAWFVSLKAIVPTLVIPSLTAVTIEDKPLGGLRRADQCHLGNDESAILIRQIGFAVYRRKSAGDSETQVVDHTTSHRRNHRRGGD